MNYLIAQSQVTAFDAGLLFGQLIGQLCAVAVGALIGAVFLRASAKWIAKLDVEFGRAYLTVFFTYLINVFIGIIGAMVLFVIVPSGLSIDPDAALGLFYLSVIPIAWLIQACLIKARHPVTFNQACLMALIMFAIGLVLLCSFGFIAVFVVQVL